MATLPFYESDGQSDYVAWYANQLVATLSKPAKTGAINRWERTHMRFSKAYRLGSLRCPLRRQHRATGPRRVGADAARRIHHSRRHRRRRRSDGPHDPGHRHQAQSDEAADGRDQQGRRRRRRRLPRREVLGRQSAQDHHHAVEPVHHAACHRHPVQLEGPHAGRDAGARRIRAVGECRQALQEREGVCRSAEEARPPAR